LREAQSTRRQAERSEARQLMPDLAVSIKRNRWPAFLAADCSAGARRYVTAKPAGWPSIVGGRLYIIAHGRLRCAIEVTAVCRTDRRFYFDIIGKFLPAITVPRRIDGFPGLKIPDWNEAAVVPFADWKTAGVFYPQQGASE
jgi:hypothetical protein